MCKTPFASAHVDIGPVKAKATMTTDGIVRLDVDVVDEEAASLIKSKVAGAIIDGFLLYYWEHCIALGLRLGEHSEAVRAILEAQRRRETSIAP